MCVGFTELLRLRLRSGGDVMPRANIKANVYQKLNERCPSGTVSDKILCLLATVNALESVLNTGLRHTSVIQAPAEQLSKPSDDVANVLLDSVFLD